MMSSVFFFIILICLFALNKIFLALEETEWMFCAELERLNSVYDYE